MPMTWLFKNSVFVSRQLEKLQSLSRAGRLPVIDSIGPSSIVDTHTHTFHLCPGVGFRKGWCPGGWAHLAELLFSSLTCCWRLIKWKIDNKTTESNKTQRSAWKQTLQNASKSIKTHKYTHSIQYIWYIQYLNRLMRKRFK